jgi:hypothetical protein
MEIEPKYVTYEQAKWIKEKGFNIPCREGWYIAQLDPYKGQLFPDDTGGKHEIEKPEQHQVVEWLRINHGIWVESLHRGDMGDFIFKVVELNENNWKKHPHYIHNEGFNSPQEAYSAAFDYIKDNNLI